MSSSAPTPTATPIQMQANEIEAKMLVIHGMLNELARMLPTNFRKRCIGENTKAPLPYPLGPERVLEMDLMRDFLKQPELYIFFLPHLSGANAICGVKGFNFAEDNAGYKFIELCLYFIETKQNAEEIKGLLNNIAANVKANIKLNQRQGAEIDLICQCLAVLGFSYNFNPELVVGCSQVVNKIMLQKFIMEHASREKLAKLLKNFPNNVVFKPTVNLNVDIQPYPLQPTRAIQSVGLAGTTSAAQYVGLGELLGRLFANDTIFWFPPVIDITWALITSALSMKNFKVNNGDLLVPLKGNITSIACNKIGTNPSCPPFEHSAPTSLEETIQSCLTTRRLILLSDELFWGTKWQNWLRPFICNGLSLALLIGHLVRVYPVLRRNLDKVNSVVLAIAKYLGRLGIHIITHPGMVFDISYCIGMSYLTGTGSHFYAPYLDNVTNTTMSIKDVVMRPITPALDKYETSTTHFLYGCVMTALENCIKSAKELISNAENSTLWTMIIAFIPFACSLLAYLCRNIYQNKTWRSLEEVINDLRNEGILSIVRTPNPVRSAYHPVSTTTTSGVVTSSAAERAPLLGGSSSSGATYYGVLSSTNSTSSLSSTSSTLFGNESTTRNRRSPQASERSSIPVPTTPPQPSAPTLSEAEHQSNNPIRPSMSG